MQEFATGLPEPASAIDQSRSAERAPHVTCVKIWYCLSSRNLRRSPLRLRQPAATCPQQLLLNPCLTAHEHCCTTGLWTARSRCYWAPCILQRQAYLAHARL